MTLPVAHFPVLFINVDEVPSRLVENGILKYKPPDFEREFRKQAASFLSVRSMPGA
jgi:hypothetical protein